MPGGSDTWRVTPSVPVITSSKAAPAATLRYQTKLISRRPASHRAVRTGDRVDEDVRVGQHLVGDGVLQAPREWAR